MGTFALGPHQSSIPLYSSREQMREHRMATWKSQLVQSIKGAITCVLILGTLSIIWPAIIAFIMGVFLFLYSWSPEKEFVMLSWPKVDNLSFVFVFLRQFGLLSILL